MGKPDAGVAQGKESGNKPLSLPAPPCRENAGRGSCRRASAAACVGEARSRVARAPLLAQSARESECSRRRAPLPWGRGESKSPRATETARRGRGGRQPRASARARNGESACAQRPRPFSARFGLAPGPLPLPHPARALPHSLTRRRRRRLHRLRRPPPPRKRGAAAAATQAPESFGAWSRRLSRH